MLSTPGDDNRSTLVSAAPAAEAPVAVRLLIVEDHELLAATLRLALRQEGLVVEVATGPSPEAVVDLARRMAPVLVLLDLELGPVLGSGLDLVGPLTEAGARVLMMTGVVDRLRLAACIEAGVVGIISKTGDFSALVDAVRRTVAGERVLRDDQRRALLEELGAHRRVERARLAPFAGLTPREEAVLMRLLAGESAGDIASHTYVSLATVRSHIRSVLLKLGVNSQLAAVALARDVGWAGAEDDPAPDPSGRFHQSSG